MTRTAGPGGALSGMATSSSVHHGRIDEDAVAAYALATNDLNPRYQQGEAVPPAFTASMILPSIWEVGRLARMEEHIRDATGGVHGDYSVFLWAPVQPGARLSWRAAVHSVRANRGGVVVRHRVVMSDQSGSPVVEHLWSNFYVGGRIDGELGPPVPDHTFPDEARSRPLATGSVAVDRDQAWRYAGVSGDHAPHALDDDQAHAEGYPTKILQGMCTFGLCAGVVVDLAAGGDAVRVRRLAGRFSAPAFPRKDLVVELFDAGRTEEGGRSMAFDVIQDGEAVIKHGRVDLCPEPDGLAPGQPVARTIQMCT